MGVLNTGTIVLYYDKMGRQLTKKKDGFYYGSIRIAELDSTEVKSMSISSIGRSRPCD